MNLSVLSNYRPISKLPFGSKVPEKAVLNQLQAFLVQNDIFEKFQSGFKANHSTETALLKVLNYILTSVDSGDSVLCLNFNFTRCKCSIRYYRSQYPYYSFIKKIGVFEA